MADKPNVLKDLLAEAVEVEIEPTDEQSNKPSHKVEAEDGEGRLVALKERYEARIASGRDWNGLDCGFPILNSLLDGLQEGVIVLAGSPSCGKTTLAKQIADHVAEKEAVPVLFWAFEQPKEALWMKSLSRISATDIKGLLKGKPKEEIPWADIESADEEYRRGTGQFLTIIEAGQRDSINSIGAAAGMAKREAGDRPILLVIDYLQIIPAEMGSRAEIRERVDNHLSELRRLARELKSPILVISSQNRGGYKDGESPSLASMKESGGIEYSADVVICLWENPKNCIPNGNKTKFLTVRVEAHVLKNREGELKKIYFDFIPALAKFAEEGKDKLSRQEALGGDGGGSTLSRRRKPS